MAISVWGTLTTALAFGPSEALNYIPPELEPAQDAAQAAEQYLAALRSGLSGSIGTSFQEESRYQVDFGFESPTKTQTTEAEQNLEDLNWQVRQILRSGQREALTAHAQLWQAQANLAQAGLAYERARLGFVDTRRLTELGAASNLELKAAHLELLQAELSLNSAQTEQANAQAQAARYDLIGPAQAEVIYFALLQPNFEALPAYREAYWQVRTSEAELVEAQDALWPGVDLSLGYGGTDATIEAGLAGIGSLGGPTPNAQVSAGGDLSEGEPGIVSDEGFGVTLALALPINPANRAQVQSRQASLQSARLAFERTQSEIGLDLAVELSSAQTAAEVLNLSRAKWETARQQFAVNQARYAAGDISTDALLESYAEVFGQEAEWATNWESYIEAVFQYLEFVDGIWLSE